MLHVWKVARALLLLAAEEPSFAPHMHMKFVTPEEHSHFL